MLINHTGMDWPRYQCNKAWTARVGTELFVRVCIVSDPNERVDTRQGVVSLDKIISPAKAASEILVKHR